MGKTTNAQKQERSSARRADGGREEVKHYYEVKKWVYGKEKDNYKTLIAFRSTDGFWKMGGNSAQIYAKKIVARLPMRVIANIRPDKDREYIFRGGVVSFQGTDALINRVTSIGMKIIHHTDDLLIVDLGFTLRKGEVEKLYKMWDERMKRLNQIVVPKNSHPTMYKNMIQVTEGIYHAVRKMSGYDRQVMGMQAIDDGFKMLSAYMEMCDEAEGDQEAGLKTVALKARTLMFRLNVMTEYKLLDPKGTTSLCEKLIAIKRECLRTLKELEGGK